MKGVPNDFWGKLALDTGSAVEAWHPLHDHCADVAACCRALLDQPVFSRRIARIAGLEELSPALVERLCFFAALHDLGKHNLGFQAKASPHGKVTAGHVGEALGLFESALGSVELSDALGFDQVEGWGEDSETASRLLIAAICHHGKPQKPVLFQRRLWSPAGRLVPFGAIAELAARARLWFPAAFSTCGEKLPATSALEHALSGLVTLADWLGSDTQFFPFSESADSDRYSWALARARSVVSRMGFDGAEARTALAKAPASFEGLFGFPPRGAQALVHGLPAGDRGSLTILESETGSGKTEAALARFWTLFRAGSVDGLYFALPTRTAATQIFARVRDAVARVFPDERQRPPVTLAVPGYLAVDDRVGRRLPGFEVLWSDDERERWYFRGWAAENPKRYLTGTIAVGTIDQVLLSALQVNHSHLRAAALMRHLLVVDEVHASDAYMNAILEDVLNRHRAAGGHALLLSATLGAVARDRFLFPPGPEAEAVPIGEAERRPYPAVAFQPDWRDAQRVTIVPDAAALETSAKSKDVRVELVPIADDPASIAKLALAAARQARVLVLRNTVRDCVDTQNALEVHAGANRTLLFACEGQPAPHHARFGREDRQALDKAIEAALGKESPHRPVVVAATQTVQQSLDLDADLLITDLCPMDVLLQRVGRLHRHARADRPAAYAQPKVMVLVPAERDLGRLIGKDGKARGKHGFGTVYADLRIIEATWRLLIDHERLSIPRMNRELVERSTHPDALEALVTALGERWRAHANSSFGTYYAHRAAGRQSVVDWDSPFLGQPWVGADQTVKTRLGEGDRRLEFTSEPAGPFGMSVRSLTVPCWLASGAADDEEPTQLEAIEGGFHFSFGNRQFTYDRLGLRVRTPSPRAEEEDLADA